MKTLSIIGTGFISLVVILWLYIQFIHRPASITSFERGLKIEHALGVSYDLIDGEGDIRKQHMFLVLKPDSPLRKAGLRSGDKVIPPHPINFQEKIWSHQNQTIPLLIERDNKFIRVEVAIPLIH